MQHTFDVTHGLPHPQLVFKRGFENRAVRLPLWVRKEIQKILRFLLRRMHGNHDDQAHDGDGKGNEADQYDGATAGGEFPVNNPVLGLPVATKSQEENEDADGKKRGAEGLAELPERAKARVRVCSVVALPSHNHAVRAVWRGRASEGRVEAEELRDCYADGGKGERCAKPGEECAFCAEKRREI